METSTNTEHFDASEYYKYEVILVDDILDEEALQWAMEGWNSLAGEDILTHTSQEYKAFVYYDPGLDALGTQERDFEGNCIVKISPLQSGLWKLYAHELGHCLGFDHADVEESLMYKQLKGGHFTTEQQRILHDHKDLL